MQTTKDSTIVDRTTTTTSILNIISTKPSNSNSNNAVTLVTANNSNSAATAAFVPLSASTQQSDLTTVTLTNTSSQNVDFNQFLSYWRSFDKSHLTNDLNTCMNEFSKYVVLNKLFKDKVNNLTLQLENENSLNSLTKEVNDELRKEIENYNNSYNDLNDLIENKLRLVNDKLSNLKDPLTYLEQASELNTKNDELMKRLKQENKRLKESNLELQKQSGDSELIRHLSDKLSKTITTNSQLNQKLLQSQNEIDNLKKIIVQYRNSSVMNGGSSGAGGMGTGSILNRKQPTQFKQFIDNNCATIESDEDDDGIKESANQRKGIISESLLFDNDDDDDDDDDDENDNFIEENYFQQNGSSGLIGDADDDDYEFFGAQNNTSIHITGNNNANNDSEFIQPNKYNESLSNNSIVQKLPDYVNTAQVVNKLKEFMNEYKVSQREAGRRIIGVKKSHVSFLLANLKPWPMLTRKGREPYIRMHLFFEDPNNIKRFMNNTYKLPQFEVGAGTASVNSAAQMASKRKSMLGAVKESPTIGGGESDGLTPSKKLKLSTSAQQQENEFDEDVQEMGINETINNNTSLEASSLINVIPYDITTVPESQVLDTIELTERIKDLLKMNKLSQELFCRAVLNLSDRILCKPKTWDQLGKKAKEHYVRMFLYLKDSQNINKLIEWKNTNNFERKSKKRKSIAPGGTSRNSICVKLEDNRIE